MVKKLWKPPCVLFTKNRTFLLPSRFALCGLLSPIFSAFSATCPGTTGSKGGSWLGATATCPGEHFSPRLVEKGKLTHQIGDDDDDEDEDEDEDEDDVGFKPSFASLNQPSKHESTSTLVPWEEQQEQPFRMYVVKRIQ